jgi:hypothetical protein
MLRLGLRRSVGGTDFLRFFKNFKHLSRLQRVLSCAGSGGSGAYDGYVNHALFTFMSSLGKLGADSAVVQMFVSLLLGLLIRVRRLGTSDASAAAETFVVAIVQPFFLSSENG